MLELRLSGVLLNITIALHTFFSLSSSVTLGKNTSSVLEQVKSYYRSTMGQVLNGFATLNIN
jgi:hypothetical protein